VKISAFDAGQQPSSHRSPHVTKTDGLYIGYWFDSFLSGVLPNYNVSRTNETIFLRIFTGFLLAFSRLNFTNWKLWKSATQSSDIRCFFLILKDLTVIETSPSNDARICWIYARATLSLFSDESRLLARVRHLPILSPNLFQGYGTFWSNQTFIH